MTILNGISPWKIRKLTLNSGKQEQTLYKQADSTVVQAGSLCCNLRRSGNISRELLKVIAKDAYPGGRSYSFLSSVISVHFGFAQYCSICVSTRINGSGYKDTGSKTDNITLRRRCINTQRTARSTTRADLFFTGPEAPIHEAAQYLSFDHLPGESMARFPVP